MYFNYRECYSSNGYYRPNIILGYYDDPNDPNNKLSDFSFNAFFDRLSNEAKEELNNILNYSNKECIDKENWFRYKISHSLTIPKISERYSKSLNRVNEGEKEEIILSYYKNKKAKTLNFQTTSDFIKTTPLNLFDRLAKGKNAEYNLVVFKESICNNEIELLYTFLNCLFSSEQTTYYVRKCKYCKNYSVDSYYRTFYCERTHIIKNKSVPCNLIINFIKKQQEYQNFIRLDRNFQNLLYTKPRVLKKLLNNYINERNDKIDTCINTRDLSVLDGFVENYKKDHNII